MQEAMDPNTDVTTKMNNTPDENQEEADEAPPTNDVNDNPPQPQNDHTDIVELIRNIHLSGDENDESEEENETSEDSSNHSDGEYVSRGAVFNTTYAERDKPYRKNGDKRLSAQNHRTLRHMSGGTVETAVLSPASSTGSADGERILQDFVNNIFEPAQNERPPVSPLETRKLSNDSACDMVFSDFGSPPPDVQGGGWAACVSPAAGNVIIPQIRTSARSLSGDSAYSAGAPYSSPHGEIEFGLFVGSPDDGYCSSSPYSVHTGDLDEQRDQGNLNPDDLEFFKKQCTPGELNQLNNALALCEILDINSNGTAGDLQDIMKANQDVDAPSVNPAAVQHTNGTNENSSSSPPRQMEKSSENGDNKSNTIESKTNETSRTTTTVLKSSPDDETLWNIPDEKFTKVDEDGDSEFLIYIGHAERLRLSLVYALVQRVKHVKGVLNGRNNAGYTPLYTAAYKNNTIVAQYIAEALVSTGEDVNETFPALRGNSLLHTVVQFGDKKKELLKCLLEVKDSNGACAFNLELTNNDGQTPLHLAIKSHGCANENGEMITCLEITKLLLACGADLSAQEGTQGLTAIQLALSNSCDIKLLELILSSVDDSASVLNCVDYNKNTALHHFATKCSTMPGDKFEAVLKLLVAKGASRDCKNNSGTVPRALVENTSYKRRFAQIFQQNHYWP